MRKPRSRAAIISVLLLALIIFGLVYYAWNTTIDIFQAVNSNAKGTYISFQITQGETTAQIGDSLQSKGLIRNALAFRVWARVKGLDTHLQAGIYKKLSPSMTISDIIDQLLNAEPDAIAVTIPEGWRLQQIAQAFTESGLVKFNRDDFLRYTQNIAQFPDRAQYPILQQVPKGRSMEGLLFPATYEVPVDGTARTVIGLMLKATTDTIANNNLDKLAQQHKMSVYTMITLASIVEREAGAKSDRSRIAGVYWDRVYLPNDETNGLLQSDPTVRYALDTDTPPKSIGLYWQNLPPGTTGGDDAPNSPWNTYTHTGFPPTPICSPGLASMKAAASPAQQGDYFFLGLTDGSTVFSKTYADFQQLEQKYLH